jgi:hypothetical protein
LNFSVGQAFATPDLDREIMRHTRSARQNGIRLSPPFMLDDLVQTDMSSDDAVAEWVARRQGRDASSGTRSKRSAC